MAFPPTRSALAASLLVLLFAGCGGGGSGDGSYNPAGVGSRCAVDEDCPTGTCYLGPGGGYCTSPCSREGETAGCPVDTVCKPIQGGQRRCLLVCGSDTSCGGEPCPDDFCPSGSSCTTISDTHLRGCEPNPL